MKQILFKLFWWVLYNKIETKQMDCDGCCFRDGAFCDDYSTYCEPEDRHFIYKRK